MGVVWGSFLNVIIFRTTHGMSPMKGRSVCPKCKKQIDWRYNIPLLSFLFLRGKCHNCKKSISWQYPVVEFVTGTLFVWWFWVGSEFFQLAGQPWNLVQPVFWLVVGMLLLTIFVADLLYGLIPDAVNLILFCVVLMYRVLLVLTGRMEEVDLMKAFVCALVLTLFFGFLWWVTKKKGFGLGDVKMAPAIGLLLMWPKTLVAMMLAFIIGAFVGIVLLVGGRKRFGQTLPFGPFLVIGIGIALIWGKGIWSIYIGML